MKLRNKIRRNGHDVIDSQSQNNEVIVLIANNII